MLFTSRLADAANKRGNREHTETTVDEEVEGVAIAGVGGPGAVGGQLLEALHSDGAEVAGEGRVLGQHHGALGHEAVYQRLLATTVHGSSSLFYLPKLATAEALIPNNTNQRKDWHETGII